MLKVKPQKSPKYSHFRILLKAAERLGIFSIPVRVTKPYARKQRNITVSEFYFCPIFILVFIWSNDQHFRQFMAKHSKTQYYVIYII